MADAPRSVAIDKAGIAAAMAGSALFSSKPVLIKLAYAEGATADSTLFWRMALSLPIFVGLGVLAWRRRPVDAPAIAPRLGLAIAANGILGYFVASWLDFTGLQYITAQLERLILFTYPFFVVFLGAAFFHKPMRKGAIPAMLIAYAGIAMVFVRSLPTGEPHDLIVGSLCVLGSALAFSLFQLFGRELIYKIGSKLYTPLAMSAACLGVIAYCLARYPIDALAVTSTAFWLCFGIAVFATVIPSYLMNFGLGRIGADGVAMLGNAGPLVTIALSALILSEPVGIWEIVGAGLVIFGVARFTRAK